MVVTSLNWLHFQVCATEAKFLCRTNEKEFQNLPSDWVNFR